MLLHDIGKPAVDQVVTLFDEHGREFGLWDPWAGPMQAYGYEARFVRHRDYRLHQRAAPLLARFIVPPEGFRWLTFERAVLAAWLSVASGTPEDAGLLGQIVEDADRLSTAADLTGSTARQTPTARVRPLHERFITGLRYLIDHGELPLNRPGATGWLIGDELCLIVKTALDSLRAHLLQEGHSGIPGDNRRLMDELQSRGVVMPNGDRAVWSGRVTLGEWQQELTLLRFPASRLWPDPATRPAACSGTVVPVNDSILPRAHEQVRTSAPVIHEDVERVTATDVSSPKPAVERPADPAALYSGGADSPAIANPTTVTATAPISASGQVDLGQAFLDWLKEGLQNGELSINTVNARVHRVKEGALLVSPGIFRDYGNAVQAPWASIQKRFQKLKLHRKTSDGFNVWTYSVIGQRRICELKDIVLDEPEKVFGPGVALLPPNPHVVLVQGKKR